MTFMRHIRIMNRQKPSSGAVSMGFCAENADDPIARIRPGAKQIGAIFARGKCLDMKNGTLRARDWPRHCRPNENHKPLFPKDLHHYPKHEKGNANRVKFFQILP